MKNPEKYGWVSVETSLPDSSLGAYFISGHEWFGIGIWENRKGWVRGFIGEWPYGDRGDFLESETCNFLNESTMWWKEIIDFPYYGVTMGDLKDKSKFIP